MAFAWFIKQKSQICSKNAICEYHDNIHDFVHIQFIVIANWVITCQAFKYFELDPRHSQSKTS